MLLNKLKEYGERAADDTSAPDEFVLKPVPWVVHLSSSGELQGVVRTSGGGDGRDLGKPLVIPALRRSGTNVKPTLLADKAQFVFRDEGGRVPQCEEFRALVDWYAKTTGSADAAIVAAFLAKATLPIADMRPTDVVTFAVDGRLPVREPEVVPIWQRLAPRLRAKGLPSLTVHFLQALLSEDDSSERSVCLICGEVRHAARTHPVPLRLPRAVADQQVAIVSANKDVFYSFGLEQSYLAPTCLPCANSYGRGLNALLSAKSTHMTIGKVVFIFWTRAPTPAFNWGSFLSDPDPGQVYALNDSVRRGTTPVEFDDEAFCAAALSGSGGRAVVRDWIDTTVGEVRRHAARWFQLQEIVDAHGAPHRPLGLHALAFGTVRKPADLPTTVPRTLFHAALAGTPLPLEIAFQAVRRNRAERGVDRQRASLIKLVLLSQAPPPKENFMVALETEHPSVAYHCGRLLAILEGVQRAALPGVNATILDRFFGTASSAPAGVFGRLMQGAQHHLARLDRDRRGAYVALQRNIEEVCTHIPAFPRTLNLEEQALFSLGYYHQRANDRAQAAARRDAPTPEPTDPSESLDQGA